MAENVSSVFFYLGGPHKNLLQGGPKFEVTPLVFGGHVSSTTIRTWLQRPTKMTISHRAAEILTSDTNKTANYTNLTSK